MFRRRVGVLLLVVSAGLIWLGTQIVDQSHGPDPGSKLFVASWLGSELWVDPWLIGLGLVGLLTAIVLVAFGGHTSSAAT